MIQVDITYQSEGLKKNFQKINNLTPQAPFSFQDEDSKTRSLRRALLDITWAQAAIGKLSSMNFEISQFLSILREGLQLHAKKNFTRSNAVLYQRYGKLPSKKGFHQFSKINNIGLFYGNKMVTQNASADVKWFNCGKFGLFRWHCPSNRCAQNAVHENSRSGVSAAHVVNELLSSMENEDGQNSDPRMINIIDNVQEFDELRKLPDACNRSKLKEEINVFETDAPNYIATHFQPSRGHYRVHRQYSLSPGLKDFFRDDSYPREVVKADPAFLSANPQNVSTFSLSKSQ